MQEWEKCPWEIILKGRELAASGHKLFTKGSMGVPSKLGNKFVRKIADKASPAYISEGARNNPSEPRNIEHVVPIKRIAIEIIDPDQHDPRTGGKSAVRFGPARDLDHAAEIVELMNIVAIVTESEHKRINKLGKSHQWDAPGGDGLIRYADAGVRLHPISR